MRTPILLTVLFAAGILLLAQSVTAQNSPKSSVWTSDPEFRDRLSAPVAVEEFLISPPKDYERLETSGPEGALITGWAGPKRPDGSRAQLLVMTFTPGGDVREADMEPAFKSFLETLKAGKKEWKQEPIAHGTINGIPFVRTRWEGVESRFGQKLYGIAYLTIVGKKVIQLRTQDLDPHQKVALAIADASVMSFRKK